MQVLQGIYRFLVFIVAGKRVRFNFSSVNRKKEKRRLVKAKPEEAS